MSISLREKIKGPVYSIITPFKKSEEIDYDSLKDYIKYLYNGGARLFYAMAFNTRYLLMTNDEILEINRVVCETIRSFNDPDTVIIVGDPLHCSTATSIEFAKHAKAHGADIISLIFRAYIFNDDQVYQHYKRVANEVPDIGILVHEMPFMKGIPDHQDGSWSMSLLDRLADIPQIVAVKEDAKNDEYTRQVVDLMSDRAAIITSGNGLQQWRKVSDKCQAWLTGIGNLFPSTELEFYREHLKGNTSRCDEIIDTIEKPFFWVKDNLGWHLGIKSALDYIGVMSRDERMPYIPLNEKDHKVVCDIINDIQGKHL